MSEPTAIDYKLLGYIGNSVSVSRAQIDKKFKKYSPSIDARISFLAYDMGYIAEDTTQRMSDAGDITVTHLGIYRIAEPGVRALQDYRRQKRENTRRFLLQSFVLPIVVSFITTIITYNLIPILQQLSEMLLSLMTKS